MLPLKTFWLKGNYDTFVWISAFASWYLHHKTHHVSILFRSWSVCLCQFLNLWFDLRFLEFFVSLLTLSRFFVLCHLLFSSADPFCLCCSVHQWFISLDTGQKINTDVPAVPNVSLISLDLHLGKWLQVSRGSVASCLLFAAVSRLVSHMAKRLSSRSGFDLEKGINQMTKIKCV